MRCYSRPSKAAISLYTPRFIDGPVEEAVDTVVDTCVVDSQGFVFDLDIRKVNVATYHKLVTLHDIATQVDTGICVVGLVEVGGHDGIAFDEPDCFNGIVGKSSIAPG